MTPGAQAQQRAGLALAGRGRTDEPATGTGPGAGADSRADETVERAAEAATRAAGAAGQGAGAGGLSASVERWVWGDEGAEIPPDVPLPVLVSVALRLVGAFFAGSAQEAGISPAGLGVVRLLAARDGLKPSEVAARCWSTPGTVTSVVDTLVRDGHVERRPDAHDRRVVRLHLTDKGRRKAGEVVTMVGPKWRDAFGYVDPADEPVIRRFLVNTIERFGTLVREERGK